MKENKSQRLNRRFPLWIDQIIEKSFFMDESHNHFDKPAFNPF